MNVETMNINTIKPRNIGEIMHASHGPITPHPTTSHTTTRRGSEILDGDTLRVASDELDP